MRVYVIGSLRNAQVPVLAGKLRQNGYEVYDDWHAAGPKADDHWQAYSNARGQTYKEALAGVAAQHVFHFDKKHLDMADAAVLLMPGGRSAHLELGYMAGRGKRTFVLFDTVPERYDVMYNFCTGVAFSTDELLQELSA